MYVAPWEMKSIRYKPTPFVMGIIQLPQLESIIILTLALLDRFVC